MSPQNNVIRPKHVKRGKIPPLSVLPTFFNLEDQPVLVVGNSDGVAWKTELFLAAGAKVTLLSQVPEEALQEVIDRPEFKLDHQIRRDLKTEDFTGMRLALGDFGTREEALKFKAMARENGVPINVIDQPEFCDFQFGSIVNRSPVVVSISTSGAAPILAQTIRARIETMLPASISSWATKAKAFRDEFAHAVPDSKTRRGIWTDFARKAVSEPASKVESFFNSAQRPNASMASGKVTLVGAGPGDAELLTIKAVRALQAADVILFDKLVSDEVLELARREARRMLVGKRGGQASCKQDDINALMVKLAKQGKNVVRLKSGDPMVFGRAGEEIDMLRRHDIAVDVVPGVTAASAVAASTGVSLTHRDCAQSVRFITAHARDGELPDFDWRGCANSKTTLMVYMGARTAPLLAEKLLSEGAPRHLSVMIAKGVSRSTESISYVRLADLIDMQIDRTQPVLIGIGDVFRAAAQSFEAGEPANLPNFKISKLA